MRAVRATRVSADAIAKAKERRERAEREKVEKEKAEAERREKEKGLGEELFGVAKGAFGSGGGGGAGGNVNPFSSPSGTSAANPFAKSSGASAANPFSTASSPAETTPKTTSAAEETKPISDSVATSDLPKTFAETLSLNNPQTPSGPPPPREPWPAETDLPSPYPVSYLAEADYETLDPQPPSIPQATRMDLDDNNTGGGSGGGKEDKEVFESTIDSTFQKFADRLAQNPDQCIRYEFGGSPLLYSKTDAVGKKLHDIPASQIGNVLPRCGHCGAKRVCEVQLTPQAIVELEGDDDVVEGMDWGAVIVAVCERDCLPRGTGDGEVGYAEEWVGVQWEELTSRR